MNKKYKISICIPIYNGANYLKDCLNSISDQTYKDFELIAVDDNSEDSGLSILSEYKNRFEKIKIYKNHKNLGLVQNWNKCISLCEGDWIKFVFQDDYMHPNCIERMMAATESDSLLISCGRKFIFENKNDPKNNYYKNNIIQLNQFHINDTFINNIEFSKKTLEYIQNDNKSMNIVGEPTNMLIKKEIIYNLGIFNTNLIQSCDYEYWARIGTNYGIYLIPDNLVYFRIHEKSATNNNTKNKIFKKQFDLIEVFHDFLFGPFYYKFRQSIGDKGCYALIQYTIKLLQNLKVKITDSEINRNDEYNYFIAKYPVFQLKLKKDYVNQFFEKIYFYYKKIL